MEKHEIEAEKNKPEDKDVLLKVYSEAINEYHYRYNFIAYTSYVALFVASVVFPLVLTTDMKNIGFNPYLFYVIFLLLTFLLCLAYHYLVHRENDARIRARDVMEKIEDALDIPAELKLIQEIEKDGDKGNRKIVSKLPTLFSGFFFICWFLMFISIIFRFVG